MAVVGGSLHKVLPQLDAKIGAPARLGMAVHGIIEIAPRIGEVVADNQPLRRQQRNGDARGAVVGVV